MLSVCVCVCVRDRVCVCSGCLCVCVCVCEGEIERVYVCVTWCPTSLTDRESVCVCHMVPHLPH